MTIKIICFIVAVFSIVACAGGSQAPLLENEQLNFASTELIPSEEAITPTSTVLPITNLNLGDETEYGILVKIFEDTLVFDDFLNSTNIIVTDKSGKNPNNLTGSLPGYKFLVSISPDSQWILFYITETPERMYAGTTSKTTPADYYAINITKKVPIFIFQGTVNSGNDSTTWDQTGINYLLNCPFGEEINGICVITIQDNDVSWKSLNTIGMNITKVSGDYAVFDGKTNCLSRINISDFAIQKALCNTGINSNIQQVIPTNGNTVVVIFNDYINKTQSNGFAVDIETLEYNVLFNVEGTFGYTVFTDREKNVIAGCVDPKDHIQPTLFYYELDDDQMHLFAETEIIALKRQLNMSFDCNRLYFMWNHSNDLTIFGEIPKKSNSWGSLEEANLKCFDLNLETNEIVVKEPCVFSDDEYYY